jgi:hypothetical protein
MHVDAERAAIEDRGAELHELQEPAVNASVQVPLQCQHRLMAAGSETFDFESLRHVLTSWSFVVAR